MQPISRVGDAAAKSLALSTSPAAIERTKGLVIFCHWLIPCLLDMQFFVGRAGWSCVSRWLCGGSLVRGNCTIAPRLTHVFIIIQIHRHQALLQFAVFFYILWIVQVENKLIGRKPGTVYRRSVSADRKRRCSSPGFCPVFLKLYVVSQ